MSVEKMEKYKEYKKHRKEILRKQKRKETLAAVGGILVVALIIGGIAFGIYKDVKPKYKEEKKSSSLINWSQYIPAEELEPAEKEDADSTENADATQSAEPQESAQTDETTANSDTTDASADSDTDQK